MAPSIDACFREAFRRAARSLREQQFAALSAVLCPPALSPLRLLLARFEAYSCHDRQAWLRRVLEHHSYFLLDYEDPHLGGSGPEVAALGAMGETSSPLAADALATQIAELKAAYWADAEVSRAFEHLSAGVALLTDRPAKTAREAAIQAGGASVDASGELTIFPAAGLFDEGVVADYQRRVFAAFNPEFARSPRISNKAFVRYSKRVSPDWCLALTVREAQFRSELKFGHLELPKLELELFGANVTTAPKEEAYLVSQLDLPVARTSWLVVTPRDIEPRLGSNHLGSEQLKRELYLGLDVQSRILRLHAEQVEAIIQAIPA